MYIILRQLNDNKINDNKLNDNKLNDNKSNTLLNNKPSKEDYCVIS